jgi:hypothetical protein
MAGLPWVRWDSSVPSHDKVLALLADPSPKRWQAFTSFSCSVAWCGLQGTDGHVPVYALPVIHGTRATAALLVKHDLWQPDERGGWSMRNFLVRQEMSIVTETRAAAKRLGGIKGNCIRHHGEDCGCWQNRVA